MGWLLCAFVVGAVSEFFSELWTIKWNTAVQARSYPLGRGNMQKHVRRTILLGLGILTLGAVDVASIFGGIWVFFSVYVGMCVGASVAAYREMWRKWDKKVANLEDDD